MYKVCDSIERMGRTPTLFVQQGQRFGRGVVIDPEIKVQSGKTERRGVRMQCDCGTVYEAEIAALLGRGTSRKTSCGCARRDHIRAVAYRGGAKPRHGMSRHPLYATWALMLQRCENPKFHKYPRYGGRGIEVCDRWHDVRQFVLDIEIEIGPRPTGRTLDRINNDGNYEPGNVQWSTLRRQASNRGQTGRSRHHGVHWEKHSGKWLSRVFLGRFDDEEQAAEMYRRAVEVLEREGIIR